MLTHAGRILYRMNTLSFALKDAPTITCDEQLRAIIEVRDLFKICADPSQFSIGPPQPEPKIRDRRKCCTTRIPPTPNTCITLAPPPTRVHKPKMAANSPMVHIPGVVAPTPRVETSDPRVEIYQPHQAAMPKPIARSTR